MNRNSFYDHFDNNVRQPKSSHIKIIFVSVLKRPQHKGNRVIHIYSEDVETSISSISKLGLCHNLMVLKKE
jgi:hypothetical protein